MAIDINKIPTLIALLGEVYSYLVTRDPELAKKIQRRRKKSLQLKHVLALIDMLRIMLDEMEVNIREADTMQATTLVTYLLDAFDSLATAHSIFIPATDLEKTTYKKESFHELLNELLRDDLSDELEKKEEDEQEEE